MKVLALTSYSRLGASSRVRIYQYLPFLEELGIDVEVKALFDDAYMLTRYQNPVRAKLGTASRFWQRLKDVLGSHRYDCVWLQRECFPWVPPWLEGWMARQDTPFIVDYDDAVFHRYDSHRLWLVRSLLGDKIDRIMRASSCVVAGNAYLQQRAVQAGASRTSLIPSVIDLTRYTPKETFCRDGVLTVGWIGTPVTAKFLRLIENSLREAAKVQKLRLLTIGSGEISIEGVEVEYRDWTEQSEVDNIRDIDIGVMPLVDEKWERGKCGYKLIQYMACAVPVIASPVGVNEDIVEHGVTGWLADTDEEWLAAFQQAVVSVEALRTMGERGREKVEQQYCVQQTVHELARILRDPLVKKDA